MQEIFFIVSAVGVIAVSVYGVYKSGKKFNDELRQSAIKYCTGRIEISRKYISDVTPFIGKDEDHYATCKKQMRDIQGHVTDLRNMLATAMLYQLPTERIVHSIKELVVLHHGFAKMTNSCKNRIADCKEKIAKEILEISIHEEKLSTLNAK